LQFGAIGFYDDIHAYLDWLKTAEGLGFDLACYGDTQNLMPDMFVGLTAAAMSTSRIRLASTVSNTVTRHPAVMASGIAGVQKLAKGRFSLGIATGDSALKTIGEKPAKVADFEAYCRVLRGLCKGEDVEWRGARFRLQWPAEPVPIWMAAESPHMMDLAGRFADGVISGNGFTEDVVRDNVARVRAGAVAAGRDPDRIEMWFFVKPYFAASEREAWREVAWTLAASANHAFRHSMEGKFVPAELQPGMQRLMDGYNSNEHNRVGHGAHNASLVEANGPLDYLGRRFLVAGTPDLIAQRLRDLASWGAGNMIFPAVYGDKVGYKRKLWNEVLAGLR
jgi:alkanesulfonate monooxygenase SsuD/methylene tetrahydromethanopterin reductase-like flavin-dependent oxidoreductase (luciferase family)